MPAEFGSISSGTLRSVDLVDAFVGEIESLMKGELPSAMSIDWRDSCANLIKESRDWLDVKYNDDDDAEKPAEHDETGSDLVADLIDALNVFAPAYGYFGASESDGADFGFWLGEEWERNAREDGALFVDDTSEVPADYSGEVVHVNDHGNATLYSANNGKLIEVWAVV